MTSSMYSLYQDSEGLWWNGQKITLRPKSLAVLRYLMNHAERVIGKEELLAACWPDVWVSPHALKVCIREIRATLGDEAKTPRFIETAPRQGYRFIGGVVSRSSAPQDSPLRTHPAVLVGREAELGLLHDLLEHAVNGRRQVAFVTGEAGIGKTAVVDTFLTQLAQDQRWTIARGQCLEHYGAGEPYMPVLQAVEQLCLGPEQQRLVSLLRQHAPTWLVQMPSLLRPVEREALARELLGSTRDRMLREAAQTIAALTTKKGLVLVLEDLHWSDPSTGELISFLARQKDACRLLLVGTYRPEEVLSRNHPFHGIQQDLQMHGYCREVVLNRLTTTAVRTYLTQRFSGASLPDSFVHFVYERTDGNPFFIINVVAHALEWEWFVRQHDRWMWRADRVNQQREIPTNIQQLIESQLSRLSAPLQTILEVASLVGMTFTTAAVAAALGSEQGEVEEHCEQLTRQRRFLREKGLTEWPDGTAQTQYEFLHVMYQETLRKRIAPGRRSLLHKRIGQRLEAGYGEQANVITTELALHFERGREYERAVHYHYVAGEVALQRYAHQEAIVHCSTGVGLLKTLPETPARDQQEFQLLIRLGTALYMTKGAMASEAEAVYDRACELGARLAGVPQLAPAYLGLTRYYAARGKLQTARKLVDKLLALAQQLRDAVLLLTAYAGQGVILLFLGDFLSAHRAAEHVIEHYDAQTHGSLIFRLGDEPGVLGRATQAWSLWYLGYPDQAVHKCQETNRLVQIIPHPFNIALTHVHAAFLHHLRGEVQEAQHKTDELLTLAAEQEVGFWVVPGLFMRGWGLSKQGERAEGIALMRQGLERLHDLGAAIWWILFQALLSEVYQKVDHLDEGQRCLEEASAKAHEVGEFFYSAELYRLKGELLLRREKQKSQG